MKKGKKTMVLFVLVLLVSVVIISGCTRQTPENKTESTEIKSDKDVAKVVGDVSEDISNFTKQLEGIDAGLG